MLHESRTLVRIHVAGSQTVAVTPKNTENAAFCAL